VPGRAGRDRRLGPPGAHGPPVRRQLGAASVDRRAAGPGRPGGARPRPGRRPEGARRGGLGAGLGQGLALSSEEAIALALADNDPPADATREAGSDRLSPREREVSRLIAQGLTNQGLTNRQIARALAITEKTVGSHVDHIMTKLDLRSRTRIAVWATQHGLGPSRPD
jgi:DNA-binding CsgD family transcriptional regulator